MKFYKVQFVRCHGPQKFTHHNIRMKGRKRAVSLLRKIGERWPDHLTNAAYILPIRTGKFGYVGGFRPEFKMWKKKIGWFTTINLENGKWVGRPLKASDVK